MNNNFLIFCLILLIGIFFLLCLVIVWYFLKRPTFFFQKRKTNWFPFFPSKKNKRVSNDSIVTFITDLTTVLARLSSHKVGCLLVLENRDNLQNYIELGSKIDAAFFPELVYSIFYNHESALHDGAMIIRNFHIVSLSSYLPISKRLLDVKYGARHRAAFGIAERSDALAFVVSETTGIISYMCEDNTETLSSNSNVLANQILDILFKKHYLLINSSSNINLQKIKEKIN